MTEQIQVRLAELKAEYEKGQVHLQQLEGELRTLRETMLRISGAIQVLEELQRSNLTPARVDVSVNGAPETL